MNIDDRIHGISTILLTACQGIVSQASGFFYQELSPKDPTKDAQWRDIKNVWIITNRHVLLPKLNGNECVPDTFTFHLRKNVNGIIEWEAITLDRTEIRQRARVHQDSFIDIAAIQILDLIIDKIQGHLNNPDIKYMHFSAVSEEDLPSEDTVLAEVSDDVVVIGYPKGFYDQVNKFPIVKAGIIASRWGFNFNGHPYFLIDAKLFPGSSGSLVITKPVNFKLVQGKAMYSNSKQFSFLGVFSGEPTQVLNPIDLEDMTIIRKQGFNLGIVWYANKVIDIVKNGIQL